ncbi:hypothetical protein DA798_03565 [Lactobacillus sp. PFC-70]|nr:hypothetical protein DA798_03565 [Lactobacillus sp. PFC-70]
MNLLAIHLFLVNRRYPNRCRSSLTNDELQVFSLDYKIKKEVLFMSIDVSNTPDMFSITKSGSFTFDRNCRVRNTADMNDAGVATYTSGMSVSYDSKYKNGNHLWLSYIAVSGARRYVPYANTDTGEYFGIDNNPGDPIKQSSGSGSTSTGSLGTLTGQAGADVASQTPDGTILVESGSFKFVEPAAGRDATSMSGANKVDSFKAAETVYYNAKIKADGHYWFRYIHTSGATYYVPYATINPFRYYGNDSNPGDPVYASSSTGGSTGSGTTGGSTGNLTPGQTVIDFVTDLGAVSGTAQANTVTNDAAFQKLFNFAHSANVTVNIPAGAFMVNRPNISSNITFVGDNGAMFLGTTNEVNDRLNHSGSAFKYSNVYNVTWKNIIFRGIDFNGTNVYRLTHSILSSHYITFNQCTFDQTEHNGGHCLDLGGSDHIYVNDSSFIGVGYSTTSLNKNNFYKEAIQTDYDYEGGVSADPGKDHVYTHLPTHDVFIDNCRFLPLYTDGSANILHKYGPQPVGTHVTDIVGSAATQVPNNIHMTNCLVLDPKPANWGGYGFYAPIHFPAAENITMTGNQIERRKTQVSPNVFMFYNYKKGAKINNSGFNISNNQIFNMNPQLVHVPDAMGSGNADAERALKYAPAYALFHVGKGHTMSNIHFDQNTIYTYKSMLTPTNQDGKTVAQKAQDIHDSANMRVKGVGAGSTYSSSGNTRLEMPTTGNGNERDHSPYTQTIYGVLPSGNKFEIATVTGSKNLPYSYTLSNYLSYRPAASTVTIGYVTPDNNVYMPYV